MAILTEEEKKRKKLSPVVDENGIAVPMTVDSSSGLGNPQQTDEQIQQKYPTRSGLDTSPSIASTPQRKPVDQMSADELKEYGLGRIIGRAATATGQAIGSAARGLTSNATSDPTAPVPEEKDPRLMSPQEIEAKKSAGIGPRPIPLLNEPPVPSGSLDYNQNLQPQGIGEPVQKASPVDPQQEQKKQQQGGEGGGTPGTPSSSQSGSSSKSHSGPRKPMMVEPSVEYLTKDAAKKLGIGWKSRNEMNKQLGENYRSELAHFYQQESDSSSHSSNSSTGGMPASDAQGRPLAPAIQESPTDQQTRGLRDNIINAKTPEERKKAEDTYNAVMGRREPEPRQHQVVNQETEDPLTGVKTKTPMILDESGNARPVNMVGGQQAQRKPEASDFKYLKDNPEAAEYFKKKFGYLP